VKVLTYNSSARGSGQFVRSLKIAEVVAASFRDARCVILAGNSRVERAVPARTTIVELPEIRKSTDGNYLLRPTNRGGSTPPSGNLAEAFAERARIIQSTIDEFEPDVFLVDSRPAGLNDELRETLGRLSSTPRCRTVLMLRDIVDDPALVNRRWQEQGTYRLIDEAYDRVVIFGEEKIFDAIDAYELSTLRAKVSYLGYLGSPGSRDPDRETGQNAGVSERVLVTVGGGFDGGGIIETVCDYIRRESAGGGRLRFTVVLGGNSTLAAAGLFERHPGISRNTEILGHVRSLDRLIAEADVVVSMGGYNTIVELMQRGKKIIAIPRSHSGAEQGLRISLLSGVYDGMWGLPERELTAEGLERSVRIALGSHCPRRPLEANGATNLAEFLSREVRLA
jgi:predicted glycosyltransferase